MRAFAAPAGYLTLRDARNRLMREMHAGVPPSEKIEELRRDGLVVGDHDQTMAAVRALREAIRSGELGAYGDLPSRESPRRLSRDLCEAASHPSDGAVVTFVYIDRHPMVPFGLSRSDVKELIRDPLCIKEEEFAAWLKKESRKKAWPCHRAASGTPRCGPGRPSKRDDVVEVLEKLTEQGELARGVPVKVAYYSVRQARSWPEGLSEETVRRALREIGL